MASPAGSKGGIPADFRQELKDLRAKDMAQKATAPGKEETSPQCQPAKTAEDSSS